MKRNFFIGVLAGAAAVCVLLHVLQASFANIFSAAMAFPFEQIGLGLRTLSLSGVPGNVVAIIIYVVICLLPVAPLLFQLKGKRLHAEDGLLPLLSITLFAALYLMINPGFITDITRGAAGLPFGKALLGGMVYSVLSGYFILRVLRLFFAGSTEKLMRYLFVMLVLLGVLFVCVIFGACVNSFLGSITKLQADNAGNEQLLGTTYIFLGLQSIVDALPYAMNIFIVFFGLRLLSEMRADRYSMETVTATKRLSKLCAAALAVTTLSNIGFNLLQLLFAKSLMVINGSLQIPVFSIAFVLSVLLLTRFIAENKQLKDDNDLFI